MKESERIRKEMEADTSDNDFRDMGYIKKIERAERKELFEETLLIELKQKYEIIVDENSYKIKTQRFGQLIFYPKANSLLFQKTNYWIKGFAINWMKKRLL
jgi:hypothetical protein